MSKKAVAKNGRPTLRSENVEKRIVDGLSAGTPLTVICGAADMPATTTVYEWMKVDDELSGRIAHAREEGFDRIALDALSIADNTAHDTKKSGDGQEMPNTEWITRSRLRVDTRLKLLAKWDPKRYGDLIKHSGADGSSPLVSAITVAFVAPGQQSADEG